MLTCHKRGIGVLSVPAPYRLEDLELGTGEGVKQIVKVCFIVDNG